MSDIPAITKCENGTIIACKIQTSASKTAFIGKFNSQLKFSLAAPPVDGKANKAICTFLAKLLKIPKSSVQIKSGGKSKIKTILCKDTTPDDIAKIFKIS